MTESPSQVTTTPQPPSAMVRKPIVIDSFCGKAHFSIVIIFLLSLIGSPVAHAHGGGPVYEKRHEFMNELGEIQKKFRNFVKKNVGDLDELRISAARMVELTPDLITHFPPDTGVDHNRESHAKMDIWRNWSEFVSDARHLSELSRVVADAFESADERRIAAAVGRLAEEGCQGCHRRFREPQ